MKGRYPLDGLGRLRQRTVDERVREVADRVRSAERAVAAVHAARRERDLEQERSERVAQQERERLGDGTVRAGDLAREAEWARGAEQRAAVLARRETEAEERAGAERKAEQVARGRLAQADADEKAVAQHRERWQRERDAKLEADEDETAGEAWLARRSKP